MRRLRTFLGLAPAERRAFFEAWAWLCASKLSLRLRGLAATLRRWRAPASLPATAMPAAARWMDVAARYCPGGASCLVRSLAMTGLLRRHGVAAELRIGVGASAPGAGPALDAHAWVEVEGIPVNDLPDVGSRYAAFPGPHRAAAPP